METDWNLKYYYAQTIAHNCILIRRPDEPLPKYWGPVYPGPEGKTNDGGMYDGSAKVLAFGLAGIVLARRSPVRCAWVLVPSVIDQDRVYADLCSLSRTAEISPMLFPQLTEGDAVAAGNRARVIRTMRGIADQSSEEDRSDGEVPRVG